MRPEEKYPSKSKAKSNGASRVVLLIIVVVAAFGALFIYDRKTSTPAFPGPPPATDRPQTTTTGPQ